MKTSFLILFYILILNVASAQPEKSLWRSISVSMGPKHYRLIDEAFSHERIRYSGTAFTFDLSHERSTNRYFFKSTLHFNSADLSTNQQRPDIEFINLQIDAGYARYYFNYETLGVSNSVYLGGAINSSNYLLLNFDVLEQATVTSCHCLDIFVFQRTAISSRSYIESSASFPLVGFIKRSSYDDGLNQEIKEEFDNSVIDLLYQHAKFSVLHPFTFPQVQVSFLFGITPNTDFIAKYQFNYVNNNSIAPIKLYSNLLSVGLRFNFNKEK